MWRLRQDCSAAVLNLTTDEVLRQRAEDVVVDPSDDAASGLAPLAPFITWDVLRRLRNHLAERTLDRRGGWCLASALAKAVKNVTGSKKRLACRKDYEYAGNAMITEINNRLKELRLAERGAAASASKAQKKGKPPPAYPRLTELTEHYFKCSYGCTPRVAALPTGAAGSRVPVHTKAVPWVTVQDLTSRLQGELNSTQHRLGGEIDSLKSDMLAADLQAVALVKEREAADERAAVAQERADAAELELEQANVRRVTAVRRHRAEAARLQEEAEAAQSQIYKLGGHVARAAVENGELAQDKAAVEAKVQEWSTQLDEERRAWSVKEAQLRVLKAEACSRARAAEASLEARTPVTCNARSTRPRYDCDGNLSNDEHVSYMPGPAAKRAGAEAAANALALKRVRAMPTWRAVRESSTGRGAAKLEWGTRLVIYSLLSMMVPCSAIGMAIVAIVTRTAPWLKPTAPTVETIRRCRFELRYVEEASSARRVAAAYKVRGIGFDETTKLGQGALTSNVTIEPTEGAPLEDVIMRAAYCPLGGTSEKVVRSIDSKCFARLRDMLRRWECKFREMYPDEIWTGPDPARLGLHQIGGGGAIQSDTCNGARCAKRLLAELIAKEVEASLGAAKWAAMSDTEKKASTRTHQHDCWQHLRNIFLAEMSSAQAKHMQAEMQSELDTFSSWERMSTEYSQLLRSTYKEFHHGCRYYKGKGKPYGVWLRETYPKAFVIHLERADSGRQDLDYDAAIPMYVDRKYFVEYLHTVVFSSNHSNILEDFLYVSWRSQQFVAATRANAIIDLLISRPLRWLTGNSRLLDDWSPFSMGAVLDIVEQFFLKAQSNGSLFLDPTLDLFEPIARKQWRFREWRKFTFEEDHRLSPDGTESHLLYQLVRDELLQPKDPTNTRTRLKTIEYLEVQCVAAIRKMHDKKLALADKLTSLEGANSIGMQAQGHADTIGTHASNCVLAESVFGTFDMMLRRFPGISQEAASALAQAIRSKILSLGDHVLHRRKAQAAEAAEVQQAPAYWGWFHALPGHEQEALVELARLTVKEMRDVDRADHAELDQYHKSRRQTNEADELDALFTRYALAMSFFDRWLKRGVKSVGELTAALTKFGTDRTQDKLDWLREQIDMRSIGLGWVEHKGQWSSATDEHTGTVEQLRGHLKTILAEEAEQRANGELPSECPEPLMSRKTFKQLGTPTVQADTLSDLRIELSSEEVQAAAVLRRKVLEEAGEIDWVQDRQPPEGTVQLDDTLVGAMLEVRWRYRHKVTGKPVYIWCTSEVMQVADGGSTKKTERCKKILPRGAVRLKWPADVEFDEDESFVWSFLKPNSFNKDVHLGWRLDAKELIQREAAAQAANDACPSKRRKQ